MHFQYRVLLLAATKMTTVAQWEWLNCWLLANTSLEEDTSGGRLCGLDTVAEVPLEIGVGVGASRFVGKGTERL